MKLVAEYFNAEKSESLFFIGVGLIALVAGIYFWLIVNEPFYKGMAIPFVLIAFIQLTVGTTVYIRSPKDLAIVEHIVQTEPSKIQSQELPRMNVVMKNFVIYRYVEITLLLAGLVMFYYFPSHTFWKGLGLALFLQAGLMLSLDYFAEKRGNEYYQFLMSIVR